MSIHQDFEPARQPRLVRAFMRMTGHSTNDLTYPQQQVVKTSHGSTDMAPSTASQAARWSKRLAGEPAQVKPPFRLLDLPAEMREKVYEASIVDWPMLHTAAIPGSSERPFIPSIAQASRQLREEALAVFYRHIHVEISLHCQTNVKRAITWTSTFKDSLKPFRCLTFSGLLRQSRNEFFHVSVWFLDNDGEAPKFRIERRPGATPSADRLTEDLSELVDERVTARIKERAHARLSGADIEEIIYLLNWKFGADRGVGA